jgi:hypothetical protein
MKTSQRAVIFDSLVKYWRVPHQMRGLFGAEKPGRGLGRSGGTAGMLEAKFGMFLIEDVVQNI